MFVGVEYANVAVTHCLRSNARLSDGNVVLVEAVGDLFSVHPVLGDLVDLRWQGVCRAGASCVSARWGAGSLPNNPGQQGCSAQRERA